MGYTIKDNSLQVMKQDVYTFIFQLYQHYRKQYKLLLVGHKKPIVALCILNTKVDSKAEDVLISASDDG